MGRRTRRVRPAEISVALNEILDENTKRRRIDVATNALEAAVSCENDLHTTSPIRTGQYAAGWMIEDESKGEAKPRYVVKNANRPSLTHLLEKGHASRNGGRVKAQKHIKPAADRAKEVFKRGLSGH